MRNLIVVLCICVLSAPALADELQNPVKGLHEKGYMAPPNEATMGLSQRNEVNKHMEVLSSTYLAQPTSDVWVHGNYAYVGGFGGGWETRIVDVTDPTNPTIVASIPPILPNASPQDVKVAALNTASYQGDLLVICNEGGGYQLVDVTDPTNPVLLFEETLSIPGCCLSSPHNSYVYQNGAQAYMLLAIDFNEVNRMAYGQPPEGDLLIYDVTDPTHPVKVADWGAGKDAGLELHPLFGCDICRGTSPTVFLHDVWVGEDGQTAYLSYWDAGLILLDVSDPTSPSMIGRGIEPPAFGGDEGNCHNAVPANNGSLVLVGDEDFTPRPSGFVRLFDTSDPGNPQQVGTFKIGAALSAKVFDWTVHNIVVDGTLAYISWYWGGIRVVDFSNPSAPTEVAAWAPARGSMWGVYYQDGLVYASDMWGYLHIMRVRPNNGRNAEPETFGDNTLVQYGLNSVTPNPFNPTTTVAFSLPEATSIRLVIYNVQGQPVDVLAEGVFAAGRHERTFDATGLASGVYFARLESARNTSVKRIVLLK